MLQHIESKAFRELVASYYEMMSMVQTQAHAVLIASACDKCSVKVTTEKERRKNLSRRKEILPPGYHLQVVK
jgi:hypothetical protein